MKLVKAALGALMMLAMAGVVFAAADGDATKGGLDGTDHDLRTRLGINQICLPCHVPHHGVEADEGPLWNHAVTTQTFTRHGENVTLGHSSKLCMSCHDGVTAVSSYGGSIGSDPIVGGANLGNDLTDDHPVGVEYPTSGPYEPNSSAGTNVARYLEDGKVECASCHYAHGGLDGKFLRVTIVNSQLCRVCHTF